MVFRSTPTCRARALTDRPWRCRSRIMTSSPSLITRSSLPPAGGASVIRCSRRSSRASPGRSAVTKTGEISDDTSGENTGATHRKKETVIARELARHHHQLLVIEGLMHGLAVLGVDARPD